MTTDYSERLAALMHEPSTDEGDDAPRLHRVELSREEMLRQGDAIRATLEGEKDRLSLIAEHFRSRPLQRVIIIGCGDSLGIGMACRLVYERFLRIPMEAAQALDFALYGAGTVDAGTLVIAISASGKTEAVLAGLQAAKAQGAATLAVSNASSADNPLTATADFALRVHATRKGWPTQSTTAAIALLSELAALLAEARGSAGAEDIAQLHRDIAGLPAFVDAVTARFDKAACTIAERFAPAAVLLFAGAGSHQAAAFFGASKIKELTPVHAISMPLEEYHHYRSQKPGDVLFLVAPDAASHARALDTALVGKAVGGRTVALLPTGETEIAAVAEEVFFMPAVRPELASVVYSVPLHLFSYHFAKARFARVLGYESTLPPRIA